MSWKSRIYRAIIAMYRLWPWKYPLALLLRGLRLPLDKFYADLRFTGVIKVQYGAHSFKMMHYGYTSMENRIFWKGLGTDWETKSIAIWAQLAATAEVVLDIGASTGVYSLIARAVNQHSRILSFEPLDRVYEKLETNLKLNTYHADLYKLALSNEDGEAVIYDFEMPHSTSSSLNRQISVDRPHLKVKELKVATSRLDSFINKYNMDRIDLMKLDVEMHEPKVLEGMGEYLYKFRPSMVIEILNEATGIEIESILADAGYERVFLGEHDPELHEWPEGNYLFASQQVMQSLKLG